MALWAYVPDKELVGGLSTQLPPMARRQSTGQLVFDVQLWANDCGYWDVDSPTVERDIATAKGLTTDELDALKAQIVTARNRATGRRDYVLAKYADWGAAKNIFQDWLDQMPGYEVPPPSQVTSRIEYLYEQERRLTQVLIPFADFVFILAQALLEQIEQSETFVPPIGWIIE